MVATLNDVSRFHDQNFVCIDHCGQAVCNDQGGFILRCAGQFSLNGPLIGRVQSRGGLIKDQDGRIFEQGSGNGHTLLFTTRKFQATLANGGVVAFGRGRNEVVNPRSFGGSFYFFLRSACEAIANVVGHGVIEQHGVLGHDAQGFAHTVLRHLPYVLTIDADAALLHIIKTEHQARQG